MSTLAQANELLAKRCSYLEGAMRFSEQLPEKPPQGFKYRHFVLHGLINASYKSGNGSAFASGTEADDLRNVLGGGSHMRGLYCFDYETTKTGVSIPLAYLREQGLDPSHHAADEYLGQAVREAFAERLHTCYATTYGAAEGGVENITQLYKGRELPSVDTTAPWATQKALLLDAARTTPLAALLGQEYLKTNYVSMWSARNAGFPPRQLQKDRGHVLPTHLTARGSVTGTLSPSECHSVVQTNPTIALVTLVVPDDYDELIAGDSESNIEVSLYCRHITTPHWMGFGAALLNMGSSLRQEATINDAASLFTVLVATTTSTNVADTDFFVFTPNTAYSYGRAPSLAY